jgi:SAM-dependent methyltransferase
MTELRPEFFERIDDAPDEEFYAAPRFVQHIDEAAIEAIGALYAELLPADGDILDLQSSWVSHLPASFTTRSVVGLGMNAQELANNPRLSSWVVHNLNRAPTLPFADASFDGCIDTVSVQYLQQPVAVFREVQRALRPGGPFILTFSNRCFPSKAVAAWRALDDSGHVQLVAAYLGQCGGWDDIDVRDCTPRTGGYSDPVFAVFARKPLLP